MDDDRWKADRQLRLQIQRLDWKLRGSYNWAPCPTRGKPPSDRWESGSRPALPNAIAPQAPLLHESASSTVTRFGAMCSAMNAMGEPRTVPTTNVSASPETVPR